MKRLTREIEKYRNKLHENTQGNALKRVLRSLLSASLALILEFLLFVGSLGVQGYVLLGIGVGGVILLLVRYIFIGMCLGLLKVTTLMVDLVNIIGAILNLIMPIVIFAINLFISAFDDITRLIPGAHSIDISPMPSWTSLNTLTKAEYTTALNAIPTACVHFTNPVEVMVYFVQMGLHGPVCTSVRYLYPIPWAFDILTRTLSWMYHGSAVPNEHDPRANCAFDASVTVYDTICASFGIGYVMIWVFLPMAALFMYLVFSFSSLGQLIGASLRIAYMAVVSAFDHVIITLDSLL